MDTKNETTHAYFQGLQKPLKYHQNTPISTILIKYEYSYKIQILSWNIGLPSNYYRISINNSIIMK